MANFVMEFILDVKYWTRVQNLYDTKPKNCLRCDEEGHKADTCDKDYRDPLFKQNGHKDWTPRCEVYKKEK